MCASERFVALMYRVAPGPSSSAKRGLPRPSMYTTTTIHAQVRRGPSGWTLGGRAGVSQPLGSARQARDGTPLVCYMAPTQGQRDAFATALPPRRTSGSGMPSPGPPTRTPHCAAVPANCISDGTTFVPASRARAAHPLRIRVATRRDRGRWERCLATDLRFAIHVSVDDQSTPSRRYPCKLRRRASNATTWHASPAPTIVLNLH